jgi:large subunit ribosomal protein L13
MKKGIEISHKTTRFTKNGEVKAKWYLVDANGKTLGRMASKIASVIRGKNDPKFTPNTDTGDFVIVINAEKIRLTGKRENLKRYIHHSMYPGGQKIRSFRELISTHPEKVINFAVRGMLPKNKLGNKLINKLKVYSGEKHPHLAQNPQLINLN